MSLKQSGRLFQGETRLCGTQSCQKIGRSFGFGVTNENVPRRRRYPSVRFTLKPPGAARVRSRFVQRSECHRVLKITTLRWLFSKRGKGGIRTLHVRYTLSLLLQSSWQGLRTPHRSDIESLLLFREQKWHPMGAHFYIRGHYGRMFELLLYQKFRKLRI